MIQTLSRLFRLNLSNILESGIWLTAYQTIVTISLFISSVAFANLLTPDSYGQYKYIMTIASIMSSLAPLGLATGVTKYTSEKFDGSFPLAVKKNLLLSGLFVLGNILVSTYYLYNENQIIGWSILGIGLIYPFIHSVNMYSAFLVGKKKIKEFSIYTGLSVFIVSMFMTISIVYIKNIIALVYINSFVTLLINYYLYKRTIKYIENENVPNQSEFTSYGLHQSGISLLSTISSQLDKVLVFQQIGSAPLALYSLATAIPDRIQSFFKSSTNIILPKFAEKSIREIKNNVIRQMFIFAIISLIGTIVYIISAPYIYKILFKQYSDTVLYSQVLALGIFTITSIIPLSALRVKNKNKELYIHTIITNVGQTFLNVLGIFYGIWGIVFAQILGGILSLVVSTILLFKTHD